MDNEQDYTKGFNQGYILAEYDPELLEIVMKSVETDSQHRSGLCDGAEQLTYEQEQELLNELGECRASERHREQDLEREW